MNNTFKISRDIKRLAIGLFFLSLSLTILSFWLISSESGLKTLVYVLKPFVPGSLNIGKISGTLGHTISLENVNYQRQNTTFKAEKFTFSGEWKPWSQKNFKLKYFKVENASVNFNSKDQEKNFNITKAYGNVSFLNQGNNIQFQLQTFEGDYDHQSIQITGGINFSEGTLEFQNTEIEWGKHKITIQPQMSESKSVSWQYQYKDISQLYTNEMIQAQGIAVMSSGRLTVDSTLQQGKKRILSFKGFISLEDSLNKDFSEKATAFKLWLERKMGGNFQVELLDLSPIYKLVPVISRLKAKPILKGEINGTVLKPSVALNGDIGTAAFSIPQQRITIKQLQLRIFGDWNKDLIVLSSGITGEQPFFIKGRWNPFQAGMPGTFQLTGKGLRIFNTANIRIVASPTLSLKYDAKVLALEGTVEVDEGDIVLKKELNSVIVSNDVIYLGQKTLHVHPESIQIQPQIQFIIKDNLHFKGYGLDAHVGGKLYIEQRKDKLYTGEGRIVLREGKYRLPNGPGNIRRGYLYYPPGSLLHDPILDIRVLQRARDKLNENGDVGVYVQGSLQKPVYHLYSSEPLKQTEILSKLGCGGTQFEGEDNQRKMLSQTAVLLGSGANPVLENIQTKFGLEEFGIQSGNASKYIATQEGNDATLVVGKALSDRIYLQFMQGMLVPSSTLKLQYFLTPYVAVSGETSNTGLGGDISFSVEKN